MRIFLTGATGFIGGHILCALVERGHEVTCLVRPSLEKERNWQIPRAAQLSREAKVLLLEGVWTEPASWLKKVDNHDIVINTIGIIRAEGKTSFDAVHTTAALALFDGASKGGVEKIIQLSAMGADESAESRYHLSKRAADRHLIQTNVPYVILRPSFVYGPGDHSMTFFAHLAALPITPVPGDGNYRSQPVHVDDLVRAIVLSVEQKELAGIIVDLGGGTTLSFNDLLDQLAVAKGKGSGARKVHIPWALMKLIAVATDLLGGHGPITRDELAMLRRGNFTNSADFDKIFGFAPRPFRE